MIEPIVGIVPRQPVAKYDARSSLQLPASHM